MQEPQKILVVGQTPPPYGGQAVMIEELLKGEFKRVKLFHVRMTFSDDMDSVGKFKFKKVLILFKMIWQVWLARFTTRADVLYYPPAGPNKVPVLRDIILLCATRFLFKRTVFHFHAGGVSTFVDAIPALVKPFYNIAYRKPDLAIRTSALNPDDGAALGATDSIVIPNGIRDMSTTLKTSTAQEGEPLKILFAGVLIPSKGVHDLIESFCLLREGGYDVQLKVMGRWGNEEFKNTCLRTLEKAQVIDQVEFYGVLSGQEKFKAFASCDIFCFPSWFEAETFGLVLVEAMQFSKPVVSTLWRGIPSVVEDKVNGFLVPIKQPQLISKELIKLIENPALREQLGKESRRIYEQKFSIEKFYERMEQAFVEMV